MSDPLSSDAGAAPPLPQQAETAKCRCCRNHGCGGLPWVLGALLVVLALVYLNSNRGPSIPSVINWSEDLPAALAKAKETRQPVLLRFSAVWCAPCKVMQREVFSRGDVAGALAKWITVTLDADKHPSFVSKYKIEVYPTFILLNSDGREVLRYEGTLSAEEFIQLIEEQKVSSPGRRGKRLDVFPDSRPWGLSPTSTPASMFLPRLPVQGQACRSDRESHRAARCR